LATNNEISVRKLIDKHKESLELFGSLSFEMTPRKDRNSGGELEQDERSSFKTNTNGGMQDMEFVSESGLYSLIIRSRKPVAKPFQKWVTREVLPSIRKNSTYSM
jgi:prophage antirepressor-like protein